MSDPAPSPLVFHVIPKTNVWGGTTLAERFGKPRPNGEKPCGETWEIVDLPTDQSVVRQGPLAGQTLESLVNNHRTWLMGESDLLDGRFPLLLKLIDARQTLSVQVHPDENAASALGGRPKTEAWIILDTDPAACLYMGLKPHVTREELAKACQGKSLEHLVHRVEVTPGDVVFIPSGTVHAIGSGIVLAELQQSSDTTYRLHDWGRLGLDGKPRELHVENALRSITFTPEAMNRWTRTRGPGAVVTGPPFTMEIHHLEPGRPASHRHGHPLIIMSLSGTCTVRSPAGQATLGPGQTALSPAAAGRTELTAPEGECVVLAGWPC